MQGAYLSPVLAIEVSPSVELDRKVHYYDKVYDINCLYLYTSSTHEEPLWTLRVVVTTMANRHRWTSNRECPNSELTTRAETMLRGFIHYLNER